MNATKIHYSRAIAGVALLMGTAIEAIKADLGAPPDTSICSTGTEPPVEPTTGAELTGTFTWTLTDEDAQEHGTPGDKNSPDSAFPTTFTISLENGRWALSQTAEPGVDGGTYEQFRDRLVFHWDAGGPSLTFSYSLGPGGDVALTPVEPMAAGDAFVWSTEAWTRAPG